MNQSNTPGFAKKPALGRGRPAKQIRKGNETIHLGYVRLLDAAPLLLAEHLGFFREAGLSVELHCEAGWATVRDKLAFAELDVAQTLSPMPFVLQMGIGVAPTDAITGMILSCNGNAITLSSALWNDGIHNGQALRRYLSKSHRPRKPVLGVVSPHSSHHFMLCRWLEGHGIDPRNDVVIAVLPPEQMVRNLASNNLDGFCAGDPWNSMAIANGSGWAVATGKEILPGYPEKVLTTTIRFYAYRPDEFIKLIQELERACAYCETKENRAEVARVLSKKIYLNCPVEILDRGLGDAFYLGNGASRPGRFIAFHGENLHRPDPARGEAVFNDLVRYVAHGAVTTGGGGLIRRTFREDLYDQAMGAPSARLRSLNDR